MPEGRRFEIGIDIRVRNYLQEGLGQASRQIDEFSQRTGGAARGMGALSGATRQAGQDTVALVNRIAQGIAAVDREEATFGRSTRTLQEHIRLRRDLTRIPGVRPTPTLVEDTRALETQLGMRAKLLAFTREQGEIERTTRTARQREERLGAAFARPHEQFLAAQRAAGAMQAAGVDRETVLKFQRQTLERAAREPVLLKIDPDIPKKLAAVNLELDKITQSRAGRTLEILGNAIPIGRIVSWAIAWNLTYRVINIVTQAMQGLVTGPLQAFSRFQQQQLAMAAQLVNINPGMAFEQAMDQAGALISTLERLQPFFIGTREQLIEIARGSLLYFQGLDLASEEARTSFLTVANTIAFATAHIKRQGQAMQELRSLAEGVVRPGADVLRLLRALDPEIVRNIRRWKELGGAALVFENIAKTVEGSRQAIERIGNTVEGQLNRIRANITRAQRLAGEAQGGPAAGILGFINRLFESFGGAGGGFLLAAGQAALIGELVRRLAVRLAVGSRAGLVGVGAALLTFIPQALAAWRQFRRELEMPLEIKIRHVREDFAELFSDLQSVRGILAQFRGGNIDLGAAREALGTLFEEGKIGSEEFVRSLEGVKDTLLEMFATATGDEQQKLIDTIIQFTNAIAKAQSAIDRVRRERGLFERFEVPETESRIRGGAVRSDPRRIQELNVQRQITRERIQTLESERMMTLNEQRQLELSKEINRERQQEATLAQRVADLQRQITTAILEARARQFQGAGFPLSAQLTRLNQSFREQFDAVRGSAQAEAQVLGAYLFDLVAMLEEGTKALERASDELGAAISERRTVPARFARETAEVRVAILGFAPEDESETALRDRMGRIQAEMRKAFDLQEDAARRNLEDARAQGRSQEFIRQQAEALVDLLRERVRWQFEFNRQLEREAALVRQRDLDREIRLLERRLGIMQQMGATPWDVAATQRRLTAAQTERELRGMSKADLQSELDFTIQQIMAPARFGIGSEQFTALQQRADAIRTLLNELAQNAAKQAADQKTVNDTLRETENLLDTGVIPALTRAEEAASKAFGRMSKDLGQVLDAIRQQTPQWEKFFFDLGNTSGLAFIRGFQQYLQRMQPGTPRSEYQQPTTVAQAGAAAGVNIYIGSADLTGRLSESTKRELAAAVMGIAGDLAVQDEYRTTGGRPVA